MNDKSAELQAKALNKALKETVKPLFTVDKENETTQRLLTDSTFSKYITVIDFLYNKITQCIYCGNFKSALRNIVVLRKII
jgi:hypothetical protein